ncbi:hypothetical protein KUCAC02_032380 [Chaenocephalus aceratus]|nr:hypothetical protein KUCAC02_032380 [Chaenocephalus aceratus]
MNAFMPHHVRLLWDAGEDMSSSDSCGTLERTCPLQTPVARWRGHVLFRLLWHAGEDMPCAGEDSVPQESGEDMSSPDSCGTLC